MHSLIEELNVLFPKGIILRSTHKEKLDDDINTLTSIIEKEKKEAGETVNTDTIRHSLQDFYTKFPFSARKDPVKNILLEDG
jgi:hypothetical protein